MLFSFSLDFMYSTLGHNIAVLLFRRGESGLWYLRDIVTVGLFCIGFDASF